MPQQASSMTLDRNISFLFKAPPGFGKTLAAASFALEGKIYIAYFDKKKPIELKTFFTEKRFGEKAKRILNNIEYDIYGAPNANEYLNKLIDLSKDCRYSAVVTDSVTNLTASAVNWSLGFRSGNKKSKDPIIPDFDEYKVETSLVTQAMDICKNLPCHVIWTAHPLPGIKIEGSGASITVTKTNPIVTYGSKVAGMVPANFSEIYHFTQKNAYDQNSGRTSKKFIVSTDAIGDDYAKSPLLSDYTKELDITDRLFYEVWKEALDASQGIVKEPSVESNISNPFNQSESRWKT